MPGGGGPHLVEEQLAALLLPQVHLLHGHLLAAVLLAGDAHDPRGALADLDEAVQVLSGVTWGVTAVQTEHD